MVLHSCKYCGYILNRRKKINDTNIELSVMETRGGPTFSEWQSARPACPSKHCYIFLVQEVYIMKSIHDHPFSYRHLESVLIIYTTAFSYSLADLGWGRDYKKTGCSWFKKEWIHCRQVSNNTIKIVHNIFQSICLDLNDIVKDLNYWTWATSGTLIPDSLTISSQKITCKYNLGIYLIRSWSTKLCGDLAGSLQI